MRKRFHFFALLVVIGATLRAAPLLPPGYRVETIAPPAGVTPEIEALDFGPDGSVYVSTRRGDVWHLTEKNGQWEWRRFAQGLQEPLGMLVSPASGSVLVAQRTEITELVDEDHDGVADLYRTVGTGWGYSGNYSEYTHGLVRDSTGNLYFTLNLSANGAGSSRGVKGSAMTHDAAWRGWFAEIRPDGTFVPLASGLRSPCGIGISNQDEIFITENQGDWVACGGLFLMTPGKFYGHPASLVDRPEFRDKNLNSMPTEDFERLRTMPNVYIPYGELANSPCQPSFNYTRGKFGPFENQIFIGDQTRSNLIRVSLEKVAGEYQGSIFGFAENFPSGLVRGGFAPDGSYWIGEIDHGWGSSGGAPGALQRVVWDGHTVPFEIRSIGLTPTGFHLEFTRPVDPAVAGNVSAYEITHWHFLYQARYYSPKLDETDVSAGEVRVAPDRMSVDLSLPLEANKVYRIRAKVASTNGEALTNNTGWYTLNHLQPEAASVPSPSPAVVSTP